MPQPSMTPQAFVAKWRNSTLKEKSSSQEHFLDLCRLVGHPTPAEYDPNGTVFCFEAGATKAAGNQGFADVWFKGHFGWEYKGKHKDLEKAYEQLLQYKDSLENPPLLIVSDIDNIHIHTNYTNTVRRIYTLNLDSLLTNEGLATLRNVFIDPDRLRPAQTTEQVTERAAVNFAKIAENLRKRGEDPHQAAQFLIRLLFCLFAEDIGLLAPGLLTRMVLNTRNRPQAFTQQLSQLFNAMASGGWFGAEEILYFDGRLFDNAEVLSLTEVDLTILAEICGLDWGQIEPSVLGTLFERSLDPAKRSQLGAHYTSREDILLIVEPVLMEPLRREWAALQDQARRLADERDQARDSRRKKLADQLASLLLGFAQKLAEIQVLDPACGSGNFLYIALRQLLDLWKQVSLLAGELQVGMILPSPNLSPSPAQLHGIEINVYAHELAQTAIWIGYIQWLQANGFGFPEPPILKPLDAILQMDAILAYDAQGKPVEPEWPKADVMIGNPPFLGDKRMRTELGDRYVDDLRQLYKGRIPGGADLVTFWFEKSRALIAQGKSNRAGLISTNSIRTGSNRKVLDRIKESGDIFIAWDDRPWILDGAAVRVSIIGFDNRTEKDRTLNGEKTAQINSDLTSHSDITQAPKLPENAGICFLGVMKGGPFDIDGNFARKMLAEPINPNGRPNSDVIKRRLGGQDVTDRPRDIWIIDFLDMPLDRACLYEAPFEYVKNVVKPIRDNSRDRAMREKWWLHGRSRPELRAAISGLKRCIVTSEVAKWRIFIWMEPKIVPDHTLHVIARDDDYFFGVLQSRIHEVWSLAIGSWMGVGNDPRYSSSRTFETFPFPWHPGKEEVDDAKYKMISDAAHRLNEKRDIWLNPIGTSDSVLRDRTMTNLYNARPSWLADAHVELDQAVFTAYGWPDNLSDEQILEKLLALNLERAGVSAE